MKRRRRAGNGEEIRRERENKQTFSIKFEINHWALLEMFGEVGEKWGKRARGKIRKKCGKLENGRARTLGHDGGNLKFL